MLKTQLWQNAIKERVNIRGKCFFNRLPVNTVLKIVLLESGRILQEGSRQVHEGDA